MHSTFFKSLIITLLISACFSVNSSLAQSQTEKYSFVKIILNSDNDLKKIKQTGLEFDHVHIHENTLEVYLSSKEMELLKKSGVNYNVEIPDWDAFYLDRLAKEKFVTDNIQTNNYPIFNNSISGTMGGYLTLAEVITKLDSMRIKYPNLISQKFSLGNSVEGRPMWTVKLSNSPNSVSGKPEVWLHGLIHAREPLSMMNLMYYMYWLLENYNIDPIATYILNNRELYITPVINPDGYEYNRSTNPSGGGMWRKNRKNNSGSFGVDLNRNFGTFQFWNSTNNGSSTDPTSDTYRGLTPFSEPETQNMRNFVNSRNFKNILSYHTYGNYYIRPWGWQDVPTPDEKIFQEMSEQMSLHNHHTSGRSNQTVNYGVRGVTDDWYYQDSGHSKIFAMTPELGTGTDGFWPAQSRILPLARLSVWSNIYFSMIAGGFIFPENLTLNKESYTPGESGTLKILMRNKGFGNISQANVNVSSNSPGLSISNPSHNFVNFNTATNDSITINFTVPVNAVNNTAYEIDVNIRQDNQMVMQKSIWVCVGNGVISFADSAENGISGRWTASGGWGITNTQSVSPVNSYTDSPTGNYSNSTNRTLTLTNAINVSASKVTKVSYFRRYAIDTIDNAYLDVSTDNGTTWSSAVFYNKTNTTWTKDIIDITSLANGSSQMKIRFSLVSNGSVVNDGIYIDNIRIVNYNAVPTNITVTSNEIPNQYSLNQNYPNPFNPNTKISFAIPEKNFVSLKIYDMLGKEIASLVNEELAAGNYNYDFYASGLSSGIYYYTIKSGNFSQTKKMTLIK